MTLSPTAQWFAFSIFSFISIAGALGMATTMSMFRSGIFLMASFIGVAGLFILLSADLLALLQVMMYIGGMLVMILYMVLFSGDPGGAMMADMDMTPFENFFSKGLKPKRGGGHGGHGEMDMAEMSMTTAIKFHAAVAGVIVGAALILLLVLRPAWSVLDLAPNPNSAEKVGDMLMGKYMMAFEGAGLLILIGIFGAVLVSRPDRFPDRSDRDVPVGVAEDPPPVDDDRLPPENKMTEIRKEPSVDVIGIHREEERKKPWSSR